MTCPCGHEWDAITGSTIHDPDATTCPKCGGTELGKAVAGHGRHSLKDDDRHWNDLDPLERQFAMDNKARYEADAERILSGEVTLVEAGPKHTRPVVPEHLRKHYH